MQYERILKTKWVFFVFHFYNFGLAKVYNEFYICAGHALLSVGPAHINSHPNLSPKFNTVA